MARRRRSRFKQVNFKLNPKLAWIGGVSLLAIILICSLGYAIHNLEVFKVREGNIKSNVDLSRTLKDKFKDKSIFALDLKSFSSALAREHPEYKKVSVLRKFPSTVIVAVEKRKPFAQIKGRRFYPVDKEGIVLRSGEESPLADLVSIETGDYDRLFRRGYRISGTKLESAFNLIDSLKQENLLDQFEVTLINSRNLDALCFFISPRKDDTAGDEVFPDIKVIIGKDDFNRKLNLLKGLVDRKLKDKLSLVKYIDLRYKKMYVGFQR